MFSVPCETREIPLSYGSLSRFGLYIKKKKMETITVYRFHRDNTHFHFGRFQSFSIDN